MKKTLQIATMLLGTLLVSKTASSQVTTQTLSFTGSAQSFTAPSCLQATITCYGAKGLNGASTASGAIGGNGGLGAMTQGVVSLTSGQTLNIYVGGVGTGTIGGYNGGGNGNNGASGAGGGASDIRLNGTALIDRIMVAGGGGGGGTAGCASATIAGGNGGAGGGGNGTAGVNSQAGGGGQGGNGSIGGAPGTGCFAAAGTVGFNGTSGIGGNGGAGVLVCGSRTAGGGGGGGYVGGGGGGGGTAGTMSCSLQDTGGGGGGAGGTNYFGTSITSTVSSNGVNNGDGYVIISYSLISTPTISVNSGSLCSGNSFTMAPTGATSYTFQGGSSVVSPTANTTYTVIGSTGGCVSNVVTSSISVNVTPTISVNSGSICAGQSFTMVPVGADTYTYSNGNSVASPTADATYTVTGTTTLTGCTNIAISNVAVKTAPIISSIVANSGTLCAGENSILNVNVASPTFTYCQGVYSTGTGFGDYISSVSLNTLNNSSAGSASPYYTIYPQAGVATTTLVAGNTYTLNMQAGTYTSNDMAAWIDYNQNGILNDLGEKLGEQDNIGATPALATIIFSVPVNAKNGVTRLRVREMDHSGTNDMDPCNNQSTFGETEDYLITISGGLDPALTFSWAPSSFLGATNTASVSVINATVTTVYTVSVSNANGCQSSASNTLTVNALPVISVNSGSICAGQSFTMVPTGADTYTYSNGSSVATPSANATYSVSGTNTLTGCVSNVDALSTVTVNALPVISVNSGSICAGQSFTMVPSGADTYTYSNGSSVATPTANATYSVSGTDVNGCVSNVDAVSFLTVNALPVVSVSSGAICAGESYTISATGALTYTSVPALASEVVTPTTTTSYTITGTDNNGCVSTNLAVSTVTVNSLPTVLAVTNNTLLCTGETATLTVSGASTYTWSTTDNTTDVAVSPTVQTTYTVDGTDANGCVNSTTITQDVSLCTGVVTLSNSNSAINVYPNPNNGLFVIELTSASNVTVTNALGQVVIAETFEAGKHNLDIHNEATGVYFVKVIENNKQQIIKVIKE